MLRFLIVALGPFILLAFAALIVWEPSSQALNLPGKAVPIEKYLVERAITIASSATSSASFPTTGLSLVGVQLPAAFTGTTLTFQGSVDGTTFQPVYSTTSGTALSYTVAQGHYVAIDPVPFYGLLFLKIVSGTSEAAPRTLTAALKGL
jgi:hypothetical protein